MNDVNLYFYKLVFYFEEIRLIFLAGVTIIIFTPWSCNSMQPCLIVLEWLFFYKPFSIGCLGNDSVMPQNLWCSRPESTIAPTLAPFVIELVVLNFCLRFLAYMLFCGRELVLAVPLTTVPSLTILNNACLVFNFPSATFFANFSWVLSLVLCVWLP